MAHSTAVEIGVRTLTLETGLVARQAVGAVMVRYGGTVVLATVVATRTPLEGVDFFPLTVDYRERAYAGGRIPGGVFKREGRPVEKEILTSRLIDRPLRPLFPKAFKHEVQVLDLVISGDQENDPDVLAVVGSSAALAISGIPFNRPVGAVRVGLVDGRLVANPTEAQRAVSALDLVIAGTEEAVLMVEGGAKEVPEEMMVRAIAFGHEQCRALARAQKELRAAAGKPAWPFDPHAGGDGALEARARERAAGRIAQALALPDPRPITSEVGYLPRAHGSALFTRGETQALVAVTLGTKQDEQKIEDLSGESYRHFMLHYNFPSFSVGEVRRFGGPGRREIGHWALAERAAGAVLPTKEAVPS